MSLPFEISPKLEKDLSEVGDTKLVIRVRKKIQQIIETDPAVVNKRFKNLRGDMSYLKRVRIGSFILSFRLEGSKVFFERFQHHKVAYL